MRFTRGLAGSGTAYSRSEASTERRWNNLIDEAFFSRLVNPGHRSRPPLEAKRSQHPGEARKVRKFHLNQKRR